MKEFDHIGIFTEEPQEGESWVEVSEVWVTNPRRHPQRIEYLRAKNRPEIDPGDAGLWKLWNLPHVAYRVDDLDAAVDGEELVYGPFESTEARVCPRTKSLKIKMPINHPGACLAGCWARNYNPRNCHAD